MTLCLAREWDRVRERAPAMEAWVRFSAQSQARERLLRYSLGSPDPAGAQGKGVLEVRRGRSREQRVLRRARGRRSVTEASEPEEGDHGDPKIPGRRVGRHGCVRAQRRGVRGAGVVSPVLRAPLTPSLSAGPPSTPVPWLGPR